MQYDSDTHKQCSKCKEVKTREEFYRAANTRDKLYSSCKMCKNSSKSSEWRSNWSKKWRFDNLEKIKAYQREYHKSYSSKRTEQKRKRRNEEKKNQLLLGFINAQKENKK